MLRAFVRTSETDANNVRRGMRSTTTILHYHYCYYIIWLTVRRRSLRRRTKKEKRMLNNYSIVQRRERESPNDNVDGRFNKLIKFQHTNLVRACRVE